jgi:hypothetical protein
MKIFVNHLDQDRITRDLNNLSHVDFSLFVDDIPKSQNDLSSINILVMQEPNEYFGLHDWAIQNKQYFSLILTWSDKVLNNCDNAAFFPFGCTWITQEQYSKPRTKKFEVSHLCGKLLKTYGHSLRHELLARKDEIKIPTNFYESYGDRYNIEDARKGKEFIFGDSMFGAVIENTSHSGYFTEKIMDCFLLKTVPIYWGCSNITEFFNKDGIIEFKSVDDFIRISNKLDADYYNSLEQAIEDNFQRALSYYDYEKRIIDTINETFKINKLI